MEVLYAIRVKETEGLFVEKITIDSTGVSVDRNFLECAIFIERNKAYEYLKLVEDIEYEVVRLDVTVLRDRTHDINAKCECVDKDNREIPNEK